MSDIELVLVTEEIASTITTENNNSVTIESTKTESVVSSSTDNSVTNTETYNVLVEVEAATVVAAGIQGPPGPTGLSEDAVAYARQIDFVGEDTIYKGEAEAGASFSNAVWRIRKIVLTGDDVSETWADGNSNFDNVWNDRLSLIYT